VFERFTDRAQRALELAQEEAQVLNHSFIGTEHILLGLIQEGEGLAAKALESLDISLGAVRAKVEETVGPAGVSPAGSRPFTPRAKKVLELSLREARQLGHNYIGTEHILLGLIREGEGAAAVVLKDLGVDLAGARDTVLSMLGGGASSPSPSVHGLRPRLAWADYPTRILPGHSVPLGSDGLEFSVTGVLVYDEAVQVFWRLSGIPKPLADLMKDSNAFSPAVQRDDSVAYVTLSDDLETEYSLDNASVAARPDDAFVGRSRFTPAPPETSTVLKVIWQGETVPVKL
jgi:hypothetical protein